jgi:hypothetical protein
VKRSTDLAYVFPFAIRTSELVNPTFFLLALGVGIVWFHGSAFFNGVVGGVRDSHRCFFKEFSDEICLFSNICKFSPRILVVVWFRFSYGFVKLFYD